mmetsp:Transcript_26729/g.47589  ORF Transcript_26729/g.47589 Transcript_26729/m.47589 type:complete len:205 (+) Transcript_26729:675-1289(+)
MMRWRRKRKLRRRRRQRTSSWKTCSRTSSRRRGKQLKRRPLLRKRRPLLRRRRPLLRKRPLPPRKPPLSRKRPPLPRVAQRSSKKLRQLWRSRLAAARQPVGLGKRRYSGPGSRQGAGRQGRCPPPPPLPLRQFLLSRPLCRPRPLPRALMQRQRLSPLRQRQMRPFPGLRLLRRPRLHSPATGEESGVDVLARADGLASAGGE